MMNALRRALLVMIVAAIASPALAADKVFEGTLVCAKCYLKKADAKECQDVLLVAGASGAKAEYSITPNEVATQSGEACTVQIKAKLTGTVSEKDGKTWLTPSKIEKQ
jgi:hypothetical protein